MPTVKSHIEALHLYKFVRVSFLPDWDTNGEVYIPGAHVGGIPSHSVIFVTLCNKIAVALCNNKLSHIEIKIAVALCNNHFGTL